MKLKAIISSLLFTAVACGPQQNEEETTAPAPVVGPAGSKGETKWQTAEINVEEQEEGFALASADSYAAVIDGCLSGYTKSLTEADTNVNVQNGDITCVFRLTSLVYLAETFTPAGGQDWSQGQNFNVTGSLGTRMNFVVNTQLGSPISGAQSVSISFGAAQSGVDQVVGADISTGISVAGADPINLAIVDMLVTVDAGDGAGLFDSKFECSSAVTGSGAAAECSGINLEDLEWAIALDTFGGADLELGECKTIAQGGISGAAYDQGADPSYPNGGVDSGDVKGLAALYTPANSDLVLAVTGPNASDGCKYWRIEVQAP